MARPGVRGGRASTEGPNLRGGANGHLAEVLHVHEVRQGDGHRAPVARAIDRQRGAHKLNLLQIGWNEAQTNGAPGPRSKNPTAPEGTGPCKRAHGTRGGGVTGAHTPTDNPPIGRREPPAVHLVLVVFVPREGPLPAVPKSHSSLEFAESVRIIKCACD